MQDKIKSRPTHTHSHTQTQTHRHTHTHTHTHTSDVSKMHLKVNVGVPIVAQWLTNTTRNNEVVGSSTGLDQWVKDPVLP